MAWLSKGLTMRASCRFAGNAGEGAQYQDPVLVVPCGDKLLGHQIHAVVQAGHQAEVGGAEEAEDLFSGS